LINGNIKNKKKTVDLGRLHVVTFSAGGLATQADVSM
jgi:pyridoxal biosynthesis lyase PdxS